MSLFTRMTGMKVLNPVITDRVKQLARAWNFAEDQKPGPQINDMQEVQTAPRLVLKPEACKAVDGWAVCFTEPLSLCRLLAHMKPFQKRFLSVCSTSCSQDRWSPVTLQDKTLFKIAAFCASSLEAAGCEVWRASGLFGKGAKWPWWMLQRKQAWDCNTTRTMWGKRIRR